MQVLTVARIYKSVQHQTELSKIGDNIGRIYFANVIHLQGFGLQM